MHMKKGGSHLNKDQPFIRNDIVFPKEYQMEKVIDVLFNPNHIKQWDNNIEKINYVDLFEEGSSLSIVY